MWIGQNVRLLNKSHVTSALNLNVTAQKEIALKRTHIFVRIGDLEEFLNEFVNPEPTMYSKQKETFWLSDLAGLFVYRRVKLKSIPQ